MVAAVSPQPTRLDHALRAGVRVELLASFVVLADELHYGRAAARMFLSQPGLTRRVQLLEDRLRVRLFDRTTREVRLSDMGVQLLPRARAVVDAYGNLAEHLYQRR